MDDEQVRRVYERGTDPTRVLALSDGVFAIILTLLVLEIHVPELGPGQTLQNALREIRPSLTAFLISSLVVAIAWAGHRDVFALIRRTDRAIVWLNFLYLLPLSILPFGAAMLATYERDPIAIKVYGMILVATVVTRLAMWLYATKRTHILLAPVDPRSRRGRGVPRGVSRLGVSGRLPGCGAPAVAIAIYALVPVLYFVTIWILRSSAPKGSVSDEFT